MSFQLHIQTPPQPPYSHLRDCWRALEGQGVDALWTWDHFFTENTPGDFEGWTLLAALAEATNRARIGVFVTAATFRHPSLLAKMAATVDHVSEGRLITGLGAARLPSEHEAFGIEWPSPAQRVRRLREQIDILDGLATGEPFSYEGRYARLRGARGIPAPVQRPRTPILIGAHGPRMLALTAQRAQYWNAFVTPDALAALNPSLDRMCAAAGRDPSDLKRLPAVLLDQATPDYLSGLRDVGADGVVLVASSNDASDISAKLHACRAAVR